MSFVGMRIHLEHELMEISVRFGVGGRDVGKMGWVKASQLKLMCEVRGGWYRKPGKSSACVCWAGLIS